MGWIVTTSVHRLGCLSRRDVLGTLMINGISMGGVIGARSEAIYSKSSAPRAKSILVLFAGGGQSQFETWDPKPHAPVEIRGAFGSIQTRVPGVRFCEHLPRLANLADRFCVFRSMSHDDLDHGTACYLTLTGRHHTLKSANPLPSGNDHPSLSSVYGYVRPAKGLPFSSVNLNGPLLIPSMPGPGQDGGFLGKGPAPSCVGDPMKPLASAMGIENIVDLSAVRIDGRRVLVRKVDALRASIETGTNINEWDYQTEKAYSLLRSSSLKTALDISSELSSNIDRYGDNRTGRACLLGRRMIEAGVPWVTVFLNHSIRGQDDHPDSPEWYGWDTHNDIFQSLKHQLLPSFDKAFSALIEDMSNRGLLRDTLVVCLGEFGRAPLVALEKRFSGANPGRKHWASAYSMVALGAGVCGGSVIGETDRFGGSVQSNRATPADVAATMFDAIGVDPHGTFTDNQGRVIQLTEGTPIRSWWSGK